MNTNRQRFWDSFTTPRANLTGVMGWNFNYLTSSTFRLLSQKPKEHAPRTIIYRLAQISVLNHTLNIQIFNIDSLKSIYIGICNLVEKVLTLISHLLVCFSNKKSCFVSSVRTLFLSAKTSLPAFQQFFGLSKVFRIFNRIALRIHKEMFNANINAYLCGGFRKFSNRHIITRERHKPFICGASANSYGFDFALNGSGQKKFKPANILNIEVSAFKFPSRLFKSKRVISILGFKAGETNLTVTFFNSLKKGFICLIQSLNNILKDLRTYRLKFNRGFSQFRKLCHLCINGDIFSSFFIGFYSLVKGLVIKISTEVKPLIAISFCLLIYLSSIEIGLSHFLLCASIYLLIVSLLTLPAVLTKYECVHRDGSLSR